MTKHEIAEYLQHIYGLKVSKVNTAIFLGEWKRFSIGGKTGRAVPYKRKDWKKAIVTFSEPIENAEWIEKMLKRAY